MNRLPFGSFHATHFSTQNVQQWHTYLQQQQPYPLDHYHQPQDTNQHTEDESWQSEDLQDLSLSKEAIEIFEFSEAYSKEQQQDTSDMQENEEERNQQDSNAIMNLATALYHDGIEAPVTSLVLLSSSTIQQEPLSNRTLTLEHLLNSAYLESCNPPYQKGTHAPLTLNSSPHESEL